MSYNGRDVQIYANGIPVGSTNRLAVQSVGFITQSYDYIAVTYPSASTEQYVFKSGGVAGTTVGTILVTFTDGTKESISSVAKT